MQKRQIPFGEMTKSHIAKRKMSKTQMCIMSERKKSHNQKVNRKKSIKI